MSKDCACWYLASTSRPQGSKQVTDGDGSSSKQPYEEVPLSSFYRRRVRAREVSIPPKVTREVSDEQWLSHEPSGKLLLLTTGLICLHSFLAKTACFAAVPLASSGGGLWFDSRLALRGRYMPLDSKLFNYALSVGDTMHADSEGVRSRFRQRFARKWRKEEACPAVGSSSSSRNKCLSLLQIEVMSRRRGNEGYGDWRMETKLGLEPRPTW